VTEASGLRVCHIVEDVSTRAGGVPAVVKQLSSHMVAAGCKVDVVHVKGNPEGFAEGVCIKQYPAKGHRSAWAWGRGLRRALQSYSTLGRTIFHIHGIWAAPQYFGAQVAAKGRVPFVVSAHGMLEPWLWSEQGWSVQAKKAIYWKLLAHRALGNAAVLHAITPLEKSHLADLFSRGKFALIPNAVEVPCVAERATSPRRRRLLFLGRLEPKKGVDILITAFGRARISSDWALDIVGPIWSETYYRHLRDLVFGEGLAQRVVFHGPKFGADKTKFLETNWVLVTPSHSEVVGLVNLEAGNFLLPSLTTPQTGLTDWEDGGGLLAEPTVTGVRLAIEQACAWTYEERNRRGEASRRLVEKKYSWDVVLPMWYELYHSLLAKAE
jgi:glycosyltransferase involved in cell wall biosynthesis